MASPSLQLPSDVESLSAQDVLAFCLETFPDRVALACSFQKEESVILDLLFSHEPRARVFAIDTHHLFPETYELWREVEQQPMALRTAPVQVHGDVWPLEARAQRLERPYGEQLVEGTLERDQGRQLGRRREQPLVLRKGRCERAVRGNPGQEVPQAERAEREEVLELPVRPGRAHEARQARRERIRFLLEDEPGLVPRWGRGGRRGLRSRRQGARNAHDEPSPPVGHHRRAGEALPRLEEAPRLEGGAVPRLPP